MIADNKLALEAGWDEDLLAAELGELLATKLGFNLTATGFEWPEIDLIIEGKAAGYYVSKPVSSQVSILWLRNEQGA